MTREHETSPSICKSHFVSVLTLILSEIGQHGLHEHNENYEFFNNAQASFRTANMELIWKGVSWNTRTYVLQSNYRIMQIVVIL